MIRAALQIERILLNLVVESAVVQGQEEEGIDIRNRRANDDARQYNGGAERDKDRVPGDPV